MQLREQLLAGTATTEEPDGRLVIVGPRVSGVKQAKHGQSLGEQGRKGTEYALWRGYPEDSIVVMPEPGVTGGIDRPVLNQIRELVRGGHVRAVIVERLDRFIRDVSDQNTLVKELRAHGVELEAFADATVRFDTAIERFTQNTKGCVSQLERELIAERCAGGRDAARRKGHWTAGKPPMGYSLVDKLLKENQDAARVRLMFQARADAKPLHEVARLGGVSSAQTRKVLMNRAYLGEVPAAGEWYPGLHEPLISEELWQRAQRWNGPNRAGWHPLSGSVRCGLCGRNFRGEQHSEGYYRFRCYNRRDCPGQPLMRGGALEAAVLIAFDLLASNEEIRARLREDIEQVCQANDNRADLLASREAITREAERVGAMRTKLLRLHLEGAIAEDLYRAESARLEGQLAALKDEYSTATQTVTEQASVRQQAHDVLEMLTELDLAQAWEHATREERKQLARELVGTIQVFPKHVEVEVLGLTTPLVVRRSELAPKRRPAGSGNPTVRDYVAHDNSGMPSSMHPPHGGCMGTG